MTRFSRQSGCTRLRLDTFRVSPSPNGDCCKATPIISTIRQRLDKFGSFFYYATGGVYVPADGAEKGECTSDDALLASVRLCAVVFCARFAARQDSRLGRIAKRFSGGRPFPCALSFALFRLPIWRVLERRGAAEPLVYSSTRLSAIR